MRLRGTAYALIGAALFGASAPFAKLLLHGAGPLTVAGLLYLGGAGGVSLWRWIHPSSEPGLTRGDIPLLVGVVLAGGVAGPALMLLGLTRVSGVAGALLLNLEAPFTMLLALSLFGEHLGLRQGLSSLLVFGGAALLSLGPGQLHADPWGVAALAGACLFWGFDNNLTQRLSVRDPVAIVRVKGLAAGTCNLALGLLLWRSLPGPAVVGAALGLGAVSYGASIVLDVLALRHLGAARESALFATAPFSGALIAIPLLGERPGVPELAAMAVMALGVALLTRERHTHRHTHAVVEHEHLHVHDAHHQHAHEGPVTEPHSHPHHHETLTHEHPHVSDEHHRHSHH